MATHRGKARKQTSANPTRKASANAAVTRKLKLPSKGRASKARILELTAELDSQMTDVHAAYSKVRTLDTVQKFAPPQHSKIDVFSFMTRLGP